MGSKIELCKNKFKLNEMITLEVQNSSQGFEINGCIISAILRCPL